MAMLRPVSRHSGKLPNALVRPTVWHPRVCESKKKRERDGPRAQRGCSGIILFCCTETLRQLRVNNTYPWLVEAKMVFGKTLQVGLATMVLLSGAGMRTVSSAGATTASMPAEGQELTNDTLKQMLDGM